jgi:hypothetical protein
MSPIPSLRMRGMMADYWGLGFKIKAKGGIFLSVPYSPLTPEGSHSFRVTQNRRSV